MPNIRIDVLKGMNSTVVRGMGDAPYLLMNAETNRSGGYRAAPTAQQLATNIAAFRQFSVTRYAYVQRSDRSAARVDLKTREVSNYSLSAYRDTVVYGDKVVSSGSFVNESPGIPVYGATIPAITPGGNEGVPSPAAGVFSDVPTVVFDLNMQSFNLMPNINFTVACIPVSDYTVAPTSPTSHYVRPGGRGMFATGNFYLVLVYFNRKANMLGTVINPSTAPMPYLPPMFAVWVPSEPRDAGGNAIQGEYSLEFNFTGIPLDYEPTFYGSAQIVARDRHARMYQSVNPNYGPVTQNSTYSVYMSAGHFGIWLALGAGTLAAPLAPPNTREWTPGETHVQDGISFEFLGYDDGPVRPISDAPLTDEGLYHYLTRLAGNGAPIFLSADHVNKLGGKTPSYGEGPAYMYWARYAADTLSPSNFRVYREHLRPRQENPDFTTFFPVGSQAVSSGGRTWVAANYVIRTVMDTGRVTNRNSVVVLNYVKREYAQGGNIRTVYYSEPEQPLDFRERFLIPALRKSSTIRALAATSSGVIVIGDADGALISGDSAANFRVTPLDIPGTMSQATVATYKGSVIYGNTEGMYLLDGGTPTLVSDPVTQEWGNPVGLSVDAKNGAVLTSFWPYRPALRYDIRRQDWAVWDLAQLDVLTSYALPAEQDFHIVASGVEALGGASILSTLTGVRTGKASVCFQIDGGSPETRKQFSKLSYRREAGGEVRVETRSGSGAYTVASTRTDPDPNVMMHVLNQHANSMDMRISFGGDTVIGGPLVIEARGPRDAQDIKEG